MSLDTNVKNLATRMATEAKALRTLINGNAADLSALDTTAKTNLVAALNEVRDMVTEAGAQINDAAAALDTVYSSQRVEELIDAAQDAILGGAGAAFDTLQELAAALGNDANFASSIATALANRVRVDEAQTFTAPQQAQARTNIGAASQADLNTLSTNVGDTTTNYVTIFETGLV